LAAHQMSVMSLPMIGFFKSWLKQLNCKHQYRYSRSKPGSLVCKLCRKRKPRPMG
jgi:hypothetical protein